MFGRGRFGWGWPACLAFGLLTGCRGEAERAWLQAESAALRAERSALQAEAVRLRQRVNELEAALAKSAEAPPLLVQTGTIDRFDLGVNEIFFPRRYDRAPALEFPQRKWVDFTLLSQTPQGFRIGITSLNRPSSEPVLLEWRATGEPPQAAPVPEKP